MFNLLNFLLVLIATYIFFCLSVRDDGVSIGRNFRKFDKISIMMSMYKVYILQIVLKRN